MKRPANCNFPILSAVLVFTLSACGGGGNSSPDSNADPVSSARTSLLVAGDPDCPNGGILVETGIDENANGLLDDAEVDASEKVCNGSDGVDGNDGVDGGIDGVDGGNGLNALVVQTAESAGANCQFGGVRFEVGIDTNRNDDLDLDETTSTEFICDRQNPLSNNVRLDGIQLDTAELDQAFQPSQLDYTAAVNYLTSSIQITAFSEDENASLSINGQPTDFTTQSVLFELVEGANNLVIEVSAEDGVTTRLYNLTITRQALQTFAQQAFVKASNTGDDDEFGFSVAISGDTLAVAAPFEDTDRAGVNSASNEAASNSGAVYVFIRSAGIWVQQAFVKASNTGVGDQFGYSIALSGDTLAVGARFESSDSTGVTEVQNDDAVNSGAVYVFTRTFGSWSEQAFIKASNTGPNDQFGFSVALSGDTLAVGARLESSDSIGVNNAQNDLASNSGAVYVFTRTVGIWSEQAFIKASNSEASDQFGSSVALSTDTLAVGAILEDSDATGVNNPENDDASASGAVYVFTRTADIWSEQAYVKASNTGDGDQFGTRVALSGDTLAVGANREDGDGSDAQNNDADDSGAVYVFTRTAGNWSEQAYIKASNIGIGTNFGASLALVGDTLAVGSIFEASDSTGVNGTQNTGAGGSGAVYVFTRTADSWDEQAFVKASNTGSNDRFGTSVGLSGDTMVVGSPNEDSDSSGVNGAQNDLSLQSGAAYVLR